MKKVLVAISFCAVMIIGIGCSTFSESTNPNGRTFVIQALSANAVVINGKMVPADMAVATLGAEGAQTIDNIIIENRADRATLRTLTDALHRASYRYVTPRNY